MLKSNWSLWHGMYVLHESSRNGRNRKKDVEENNGAIENRNDSLSLGSVKD